MPSFLAYCSTLSYGPEELPMRPLRIRSQIGLPMALFGLPRTRHVKSDCRAFIRRRPAVRALIGRWLDFEPETVRFSSNAYGRPLLAWPTTSNVFSFSVARTTDVALLSIARCESIGVDIERVRHNIDFPSVGRVAFADSELVWMMACDRNTMAGRFFRLWTRKEAYLKALGWGFLRDPRLFVPSVIDEEARDQGVHAIDPEVPKSGDLFELPLGKTLRGAFAVG